MRNNYNNPEVGNFLEEKEESIDIIGVLSKMWSIWPWILVSVIICLAITVFYLLKTPPTYNVTTSILINESDKGGRISSEMAAFSDLFSSTASSFDNELDIMKSKSLVKEVIWNLNQYVTYQKKDGLAKIDMYTQSPLIVEMSQDDNDKMITPISIQVIMHKDASITVIEQEGFLSKKKGIRLNALPETIETPYGILTFSYRNGVKPIYDELIFIDVYPAIAVARKHLSKNLGIEPTSRTTSVAKISLQTLNKEKGIDFLYKYIDTYNQNNNENRNKVGMKTEMFIEERLIKISGELEDTEQKLETFKRESGLTNIEKDASIFLSESSKYEQRAVEIATQVNLVKYLSDYVSKPENKYTVIPANIGLEDATLTALINTYNTQVLERDRLMRTSSSNNPVIQNLSTSIHALYENIQASVVSVRRGLLITQRDMEKQLLKANTRITKAPEQERILRDIERQQQIQSGLYLLLLEKRETNAISMAAAVDNAIIIDDPLADVSPIAPKKKIIVLIALLVGVILPVFCLYVKNLMQYKIVTRSDVEQLTPIPIIGTIPQMPKKMAVHIVIQENKNTFMTEAFRSLRTNLRFMLSSSDQKVIMLTSTSPEEGKTFISTNLAISFAMLGKKVVIIGMDIRKPRLAECFGLSNKNGLTQYLSGAVDDIASLLLPSGITENLMVMVAGKIPPNPAELLASERLEKLIAILRNQFDYILIDSAPISLVSDGLITARVVDISLYICRSKTAHKSDFDLINSLHNEEKLPRMTLVVNGVGKEKRYGNYYGYGDE